jgi:hypothetical protein
MLNAAGIVFAGVIRNSFSLADARHRKQYKAHYAFVIVAEARMPPMRLRHLIARQRFYVRAKGDDCWRQTQ